MLKVSGPKGTSSFHSVPEEKKNRINDDMNKCQKRATVLPRTEVMKTFSTCLLLQDITCTRKHQVLECKATMQN